MKLPVEGTATVEVSAHVSSREEMSRLITLDSSFRDARLKWRAVVHINNRMEWQWCETKEEAETWCLSRLPKTFARKTAA
jgi:hypothetical protein